MEFNKKMKRFNSIGYTNFQGRGDMFFVNNDIK